MQRAQEFLINHLKTTGESYDEIEDKSGVSKATISRMMKGQTVSTASLRLIADAYGQMDEFLAVVSASADPKRAADELHEMYKHSEQLITENCEERLRSMKGQLTANEKMHEREMRIIMDSDKRVIDTLEKSVEKHFLIGRRVFGQFVIFPQNRIVFFRQINHQITLCSKPINHGRDVFVIHRPVDKFPHAKRIHFIGRFQVDDLYNFLFLSTIDSDCNRQTQNEHRAYQNRPNRAGHTR